MFPNKINFTADGNEVVFEKIITHDGKGEKLKEPLGVYRYTKSNQKLGKELTMPIDQIERLGKDLRIEKQ